MEVRKADTFEEINDVIEELTTTGTKQLNEEYMKKLKRHCKCSNDNIEIVYTILMSQLEKPHAEIRYSSLQIINELFVRSHAFREAIVLNLHIIFPLTIGTNLKDYPVPLPAQVANELKLFALTTCKEWYAKYGRYYRKLALGYEFLRDVKKVDFCNVDCLTAEQRERKKRRIEKEERIRKHKLEQVDIQFHDSYNDIMSNVHQIENCFQLLMPKLVQEDSTGDSKTKKEDGNNKYGLTKSNKKNGDKAKDVNKIEAQDSDVGTEIGIHRSYQVTVAVDKNITLLESEDNQDVVSRTEELYKEVKQQITIVRRWLHVLVKCRSTDHNKLKDVLALKNMMTSMMEKYSELNIVKNKKENESESDDEFIEVPEVHFSKNLEKTQKVINPTSHKTDTIPAQNVESKNASLNESHAQQPGPSSSRKVRLLEVAPVLPYGADLQHWGQEKIKAPLSVKTDSLHRFWKPAEHEETFVPEPIAAAMKSRRMLFVGRAEVIQKKCGAILPNGNFCERMDRFKCPFHGDIVERDGFGRPVNSEAAEKELKRKHEKETADRVSIQKEIDAALGTSLSSKKRKKRETPVDISKARYARLTKINIDKSKDGSKRLEKKIFNHRAMMKVYQNLNDTIRKKHDEKFGSNFNY